MMSMFLIFAMSTKDKRLLVDSSFAEEGQIHQILHKQDFLRCLKTNCHTGDIEHGQSCFWLDFVLIFVLVFVSVVYLFVLVELFSE